MALIPARCIRGLQRAWTRTAKKVVTSAYIRGVPDSKIKKFDAGTRSVMASAEITLDLVAQRDFQMRHNSLDAARVAANKFMEAEVLLENYYLVVRVYPHQVLREHKMQAGAGADRLSQGMKHAFGRPTGRAVVLREGQTIMTIYTYKKFLDKARLALRKASVRISFAPQVVVTDLTVKPKVVEKIKEKPKQVEAAVKKEITEEKIKPAKKESINKSAERVFKEVGIEKPKQEPKPEAKPIAVPYKKESLNKVAEQVLKETGAIKPKKPEPKKPEMIIA